MDFKKLSYISSAGLRVILKVQQYLEENGFRKVKIQHPNANIKGTFEVTGLVNLVNIK